MPTDIILYALVAAGLVFWLRSLLGTRHGEERDRINPFATPVEKKVPASVHPAADSIAAIDLKEEPPALPPTFTINPQAEDALAIIARADHSFDLSHFAAGAADAFAYVVEAFADGDRNTLKDLLSPSVYKAFDAALQEREKLGETVKTEIHSVRKTELQAAWMQDKMIYLRLQFTADETCVIRGKDGQIISGDPDKVTEMIDVWTFGRPIKSKDPRWMVYQTNDGDVSEEHKTPVPDTHL